MKHPKTLRASVRHFGGGSPGTPYISDGDSARVLFFFNMSGAYDGNVGFEQARADADEIARRYNCHEALVEALEDIVNCEENRAKDLKALDQKPPTLYAFSQERVDKAREALKKAKKQQKNPYWFISKHDTGKPYPQWAIVEANGVTVIPPCLNESLARLIVTLYNENT